MGRGCVKNYWKLCDVSYGWHQLHISLYTMVSLPSKGVGQIMHIWPQTCYLALGWSMLSDALRRNSRLSLECHILFEWPLNRSYQLYLLSNKVSLILSKHFLSDFGMTNEEYEELAEKVRIPQPLPNQAVEKFRLRNHLVNLF